LSCGTLAAVITGLYRQLDMAQADTALLRILIWM